MILHSIYLQGLLGPGLPGRQGKTPTCGEIEGSAFLRIMEKLPGFCSDMLHCLAYLSKESCLILLFL